MVNMGNSISGRFVAGNVYCRPRLNEDKQNPEFHFKNNWITFTRSKPVMNRK